MQALKICSDEKQRKEYENEEDDNEENYLKIYTNEK